MWPRGRSARRRRGTSRPTGTRASASSCSTGWSAAWSSRAPRSKSLRGGTAQIKDGYAQIRDGELWLHNVHIPPYGPAARENHEPERPRKLLAHQREIERLDAQVAERGLTLVPTRLYFKGSRAKVEIALAKGKDRFDKRESLKAKDQKRDMQRALSERY